MKHHLSAFRRSPWLSVACLLILGLMLAPVGLMAATTAAATPGAHLAFDPLTLGALGFGAIMLRAPAADEGEGGGDPKAEDKLDLAQAVAQIEDRTLPISQRLGIAAKVLKGIDPTQQLAGVQKQLGDVQASITLKDAEITKLKADLLTAQQSLTARETDVTQLEAQVAALEKEKITLTSKEQDIDKRAASKSKEHVAALGFPAAKLPGSQTEQGFKDIPESEAKLEEALKACATQQERSALLRSYYAARGAGLN